MKPTNLAIAVIVVVCRVFPCDAQRSDPPRQQRTIAETVDSWITNAESEVVPLADAMPAERYTFAPPATIGEFTGVRTFAQQVKHLAANNYWMAAMMLQHDFTDEMSTERGPDSVKTKAQIMEYLKGSFAALHAAVATITPENVVAPISTPSDWQRNRLSLAVDAIGHSYDHYGQMVEYLRMNGIVPPASRPARVQSPSKPAGDGTVRPTR